MSKPLELHIEIFDVGIKDSPDEGDYWWVAQVWDRPSDEPGAECFVTRDLGGPKTTAGHVLNWAIKWCEQRGYERAEGGITFKARAKGSADASSNPTA